MPRQALPAASCRSCRTLAAMELRNFPLACRWTDERYAVLPEHVLVQITPQTAVQSKQLFEASLQFTGSDGLDEKQFFINQLITKDKNPLAVSNWLRTHHSSLNTSVFLSWQPDTAVITTWGIFAEYWSEFCYPDSDDLLVWSSEHDWVILYHHEEFFQYGTRS